MPEGMYKVQTSLRFEQSSSKLPSNNAEGLVPPSMKEAITIIVVNKKKEFEIMYFSQIFPKGRIVQKIESFIINYSKQYIQPQYRISNA